MHTIPPATLEAFRAHGRPRASLEEDVEGARTVIEALERAGISLDDVTDTLVEDGVTLFSEAFDILLAAVDTGRQGELRSMLDRQRYTLPHDLAVKVTDLVADCQKCGKARRLWARAATLWTGGDESHWLDWLGITDDQVAHSGPLKEVAPDDAGVAHAVLPGMGGSPPTRTRFQRPAPGSRRER